MAGPDMWIVIPNWQKFQHYSDRNPPWIKDYLDQHDREEYMELTFRQRGLLQDLRRLYAKRDGLVHADVKRLSRAFNQTVTVDNLQALNHAGFIGFLASKPLSLSSSVKPSNTGGRGNKGSSRSEPCPFCEVGGGLHAADCPTLEDVHLMVDHLRRNPHA